MSATLALILPQLMLAAILLPMATAAAMLLLGEERRPFKIGLNIASTALGLLIATALLVGVDAGHSASSVGVYLSGNWQAPFGIVLVLDRLSALMMVLTGTVALASVLFAAVRWNRAGVHYHPLFQLQLMGLYGAFLTGDLFNLFVFFEIMLSASYGLLLHGSGRIRVQAGLHYIAVNLVASSLFLIGTALLYGVTGTLNMADMALKIAAVAPADRGLLHAGAGILAVAFLTKAAVWPLNFWLVPAYSAATAPVGALFALMTKVGVYALLRLSTLLFAPMAGVSAGLGNGWLQAAGLATVAFGTLGLLGSQRLGFLAGYAVIVSSGTLLAAIGFGQAGVTAGALYYLVSSTLAAAALFLLVDLIERWRNDGAVFAPHEQPDHAPFLTQDLRQLEGLNLDETQDSLVGRAIPGATALLGLAFLCCALLVAGLPPLPGFIGKLAMLTAAIQPTGPIANPLPPSTPAWALLALLLASGLMAMVAMTRAGMRHFWAAPGRGAPHLARLEGVALGGLLVAAGLLVVFAGPVLRYTQATAQALHTPAAYIAAVMAARPVSNPAHRPGPTLPPPDSTISRPTGAAP